MQNKIQQILDTQGAYGESSSQSNDFAPLEGDALFQVFGPEKNERVRGMGFGVTPKMFANSNLQSLKENEQLREKNKNLEDKFEELKKEAGMLHELILTYLGPRSIGLSKKVFQIIIIDFNISYIFYI